VRSLFCKPAAVLLLTAAVLVFAAEAGAGPNDHDGGFFLRLSGGFGYASSKVEIDDISFQLSGLTGDVNFAIGGVVTPNLALHATLWGWTTSDPELEVCESGHCESGTVEEVDFGLTGFGGGVTYYFMPSNFYISGSICVANLSLTYQGATAESEYGPAIDITAGKEWWVSSSWGLGVAGAFGYHWIGEEAITEKWSGPSFAVRFSATYN